MTFMSQLTDVSHINEKDAIDVNLNEECEIEALFESGSHPESYVMVCDFFETGKLKTPVTITINNTYYCPVHVKNNM